MTKSKKKKYLITFRQLHSTIRRRHEQSTNTEDDSDEELMRPLQNQKFYRRVYRPIDHTLSHLNPPHISYPTHYPTTYAYVSHVTPSVQISSLRFCRYFFSLV